MEFWFEFASTYSYPAAMRIEALARSAGVELVWRPFLLGPIFNDQGWNDSPFNIYPEKGRYMWRDLERICNALEIPLRRPTQFPQGGLLAARVACRFQQEAWQPEFVRRVYTANFAQDRTISDPEVIVGILGEIGQPRERLDEAGAPDAKAALRAQTEAARDRGIFGAPSFVVAGELFWGNDRLETAIEWAKHVESNR